MLAIVNNCCYFLLVMICILMILHFWISSATFGSLFDIFTLTSDLKCAVGSLSNLFVSSPESNDLKAST